MAKVELKIDTTEATEILKALKAESERLKTAMVGVKQAAEHCAKAARDFADEVAALQEKYGKEA